MVRHAFRRHRLELDDLRVTVEASVGVAVSEEYDDLP